jgi:F-type H+-transporting ATPase subunit delta
MRNPSVANRYAKALIDLAQETNTLDVVKKDVDFLRANSHTEFTAMMNSPVIRGNKKSEIFKAIFHGRVSELTESFFNLVFRKGREFVISDIGLAFDQQYNEIKGIVKVQITSAVPLSTELHDNIFKRIEALPRLKNKSVQLTTKIDEDIIGGFILELEDDKFDASVRHDLHFIKREFIQNLYKMKI